MPLAAHAQIRYDAGDNRWHEAVYAASGINWTDAAATALVARRLRRG